MASQEKYLMFLVLYTEDRQKLVTKAKERETTFCEMYVLFFRSKLTQFAVMIPCGFMIPCLFMIPCKIIMVLTSRKTPQLQQYVIEKLMI